MRGTCTTDRELFHQRHCAHSSSVPTKGTYLEDNGLEEETTCHRGATLKWASDEGRESFIRWSMQFLFFLPWLLRHVTLVRWALRDRLADPGSWRYGEYQARTGATRGNVLFYGLRDLWWGTDSSRAFVATVAFWRSQGWFRVKRPRWLWRSRWRRWWLMWMEVRCTTRRMQRGESQSKRELKELLWALAAEAEMDGVVW